MAEVKDIIKQMKDAGMSDPDIVENLKELGIKKPEEELSKALREIEKNTAKKQGESEESLRITKIRGEQEEDIDVKKILEGGEPELMKKVAYTNFSKIDQVEDKLDQVIALLKALHELNKKILETNRDLLVKASKDKDGEKPTLGKLF